MRCKNCGGNITLENGLAVCISCGSKFEFEKAFENIDVFICCLDTDASGRRTKDSIIAQEIYNKLENAKVSVFFERISASNLADDSLEKAYYSAIHNAKIVLILGTEESHYERVFKTNSQYFGDKKVLPIYSGIDVTKLPEELKKFQALNYDAVGASTDLVNNVLMQLGRQGEIDIIQLGDKVKRRKRIALVSIILVLLMITIGAGVYYIFGTPYVLDDNKYAYVQELIEEENYIEAMEILCELGDYKNSKNLLSNLYAKYEGYYWDEGSNMSLHLNISDDHRVDVEIVQNVEGAILRIIESSQIRVNKVKFDYIDSENNNGTVTMILTKDAVDLHVSTEGNQELSFGSQQRVFCVAEKSDKPISKKVDAVTLLKWLDERITISELERQGYELENNGNLFPNMPAMNNKAYSYKIKNTDIELAAFGYNFADESNPVDDFIVFGIFAPASIVLSNKIGNDKVPFVEDSYLYVPGGGFYSSPDRMLYLGIMDYTVKEQIKNDTRVIIASRKGAGEAFWKELLNYSIGDYAYSKVRALQSLDGIVPEGGTLGVETYIVAENNTDFLVAQTCSGGWYGWYIYYKLNKSTYEIVPMSGIAAEIFGDAYEAWTNFPEYFPEFISATK